MDNHLHFIWQPLLGQTLQTIQHSFLKHTAQVFKADLQKNNAGFLTQFKVTAKDRQYQFWERNSLSIELYSNKVLYQKLVYVHNNPVKAGLCVHAVDYYFLSVGVSTHRNARLEKILVKSKISVPF